MSIWRTKRRYEESRRFNERADAALLAISILRNEAEGVSTAHTDSDLKSQLTVGQELIEDLAEALANPERADDYTYALAHKLCDTWRMVPEDVVDKLEEEAVILNRTRQTLQPAGGLDDVEATLEDIDEIAAKTSQSEAERLRSNLVN